MIIVQLQILILQAMVFKFSITALCKASFFHFVIKTSYKSHDMLTSLMSFSSVSKKYAISILDRFPTVKNSLNVRKYVR